MKSALVDIFKWGIILIIGAIAFYMAVPKYQFDVQYRYNKVTGTMSYTERDFGK